MTLFSVFNSYITIKAQPIVIAALSPTSKKNKEKEAALSSCFKDGDVLLPPHEHRGGGRGELIVSTTKFE